MIPDKDKEIISKIKTMSDSDISQRTIWGKIFLLLCIASVILFVFKLLGKNSGLFQSNTSERWEMYALLILTTFSMGFGFLTTGKLLGVIKRLSNKADLL